MIIGIYTNPNKDPEGKITKNLFSLLKEESFNVIMSDELLNFKIDSTYHSRNELAKKSDILFVLGGDGTILRIAKECALHNTLIYAINLGSKGFLSESENREIKKQINVIKTKNYVVDERRLLEVQSKNNKFYALNEAVLARGSRIKTIKFEFRVNDALVDKYLADGVIISTPTGTTAYNLSAGGPVVSPDVRAFIVTPLSAHSLHSKPIVISDENTIWIHLLKADPYAHLSIDGEDVKTLVEGDSLKISTSDLIVKFIRKSNYNFFERLMMKFKKWSEI